MLSSRSNWPSLGLDSCMRTLKSLLFLTPSLRILWNCARATHSPPPCLQKAGLAVGRSSCLQARTRGFLYTSLPPELGCRHRDWEGETFRWRSWSAERSYFPSLSPSCSPRFWVRGWFVVPVGFPREVQVPYLEIHALDVGSLPIQARPLQSHSRQREITSDRSTHPVPASKQDF